MTNLDGTPESTRNPSKMERFAADMWKSSSHREAREFDEKFNVAEVTGFEDQAKELWLTYFASYWAAKKFNDSEVPMSVVDAAKQMPLMRGIAKFIRGAVNSYTIANVELKQEAEVKAIEYVNHLQNAAIESTANVINENYSQKIAARGIDADEVIEGMKSRGSWNRVMEVVTHTYGSARDIQLSANLLCLIYYNNQNEDPEILLKKLKNASARFAPVKSSEELEARMKLGQ